GGAGAVGRGRRGACGYKLTARIGELETSRARVMDAAEAERMRIERDLHDGAQQRLVSLAMELGRAKAKFGSDPEEAAAIVSQAHEQAKEALAELRDLVRGVHPPVLTDRGLDAALSGLAARCPVPVEVHVDVPVRPKAAVEAVAYFLVAEALTNIAKHSRASPPPPVLAGHGPPGPATPPWSSRVTGIRARSTSWSATTVSAGPTRAARGWPGSPTGWPAWTAGYPSSPRPAARRSSRRCCHAGSDRGGLGPAARGADPAAGRGRP